MPVWATDRAKSVPTTTSRSDRKPSMTADIRFGLRQLCAVGRGELEAEEFKTLIDLDHDDAGGRTAAVYKALEFIRNGGLD